MDILNLGLSPKENDEPTEGEIRWQAALIASLLTVVAALGARFAGGAPLIPELMANFIFSVAPISLVEFAVSLLGVFAKHLAFLGCLVLYLMALTAAGAGNLRFAAGRQQRTAVWFALLLSVVTLLIVVPFFGGGPLGENLRQGAVITSAWQLALSALYAASLMSFQRLYAGPSSRNWRIARTGEKWLSRRYVLRGIGYAVIGVGAFDILRPFVLSWRQSTKGQVSVGNGIFPHLDGLAKEVTPTEDFYQVSKNPFDPEVDLHSWKVEVTGLVQQPLSLTYDGIKTFPVIEEYATLECISNPVGGDLIGNAFWRGVRLHDVLERAKLQPGVVDLVLTGADGYSDSIPLDRVRAEGTILAFEMNHSPLTSAHGFPLRLIVPGIYGMKNVKWITRIEAVKYDYKGFWQVRGWDDRAECKTMSRIDVPRKSVHGRVVIAGVAFAGDRGIRTVEVSTDGGRTWESVELKQPLSRFSWVLWHKEWTPGRAGSHSLVVRAIDGLGQLQSEEEAPPIPSGAAGYDHRGTKSE